MSLHITASQSSLLNFNLQLHIFLPLTIYILHQLLFKTLILLILLLVLLWLNLNHVKIYSGCIRIALFRNWAYLTIFSLQNSMHDHRLKWAYLRPKPLFSSRHLVHACFVVDLATNHKNKDTHFVYKALYKLKQAHRAWYMKFSNYNQQMHFQRSSPLSILVFIIVKVLLILIYFDGILITIARIHVLVNLCLTFLLYFTWRILLMFISF